MAMGHERRTSNLHNRTNSSRLQLQRTLHRRGEFHPQVNSADAVVGYTSHDNVMQLSYAEHAIRKSRVVFLRKNGDDIEILLQQRSEEKKRDKLQWEILSEHVNVDRRKKRVETYKEAARRGIREELGIKKTKGNIKFIGRVTDYVEGVEQADERKFHITTFIAHLQESVELHLNTHEVQQSQWFTLSRIDELLSLDQSPFIALTRHFLQNHLSYLRHIAF